MSRIQRSVVRGSRRSNIQHAEKSGAVMAQFRRTKLPHDGCCDGVARLTHMAPSALYASDAKLGQIGQMLEFFRHLVGERRGRRVGLQLGFQKFGFVRSRPRPHQQRPVVWQQQHVAGNQRAVNMPRSVQGLQRAEQMIEHGTHRRLIGRAWHRRTQLDQPGGSVMRHDAVGGALRFKQAAHRQQRRINAARQHARFFDESPQAALDGRLKLNVGGGTLNIAP